MLWKELIHTGQLEELVKDSYSYPVAIYKHSTYCSISSVAKRRLESQIAVLQIQMDFYFLDLIRYRTLSDEIAKAFSVRHESPQLLVIHHGKSIYDGSHFQIDLNQAIQSLSTGSGGK